MPDLREVVVLSYLSRSGSTYLSMLLHAEASICVTPEARFPPSLLGFRPAQRPLSDPKEVRAYVRFLQDDYKFAAWRLDPDKVVAHTLDHVSLPAAPHTLLHPILNAYAVRHKSTSKFVIFKKGIGFVDRISALHRTLPGARLLHIVRDPRATYASQIAAYSSRHGMPLAVSAYDFGLRWARTTKRAVTLSEEGYAHVVRYEDLVREQTSTLGAVAAWLGTPALALQEARTEYANVIPDEQLHLHTRLQVPPDPTRIDAWRNSLDPEDADGICAAAGAEMARIGYSPATASDGATRHAQRLLRDRISLFLRALVAKGVMTSQTIRSPRRTYRAITAWARGW